MKLFLYPPLSQWANQSNRIILFYVFSFGSDEACAVSRGGNEALFGNCMVRSILLPDVELPV